MQAYEGLKYTMWDCKQHVVFIPKCRRNALHQGLRRELDERFRSLAEQWGMQSIQALNRIERFTLSQAFGFVGSR